MGVLDLDISTPSSTVGGTTPPRSKDDQEPLRRLHPEALAECQRHLRETTGIRFALWDTQGRRLTDPEGPPPADRQVPPLLEGDEAAVSAIIHRASQTQEAVVEESDVGIVSLAVPVRFRRGVVAVAVGRYLAVEALAEPILSRLAAHLGVDGDTARDRWAPLALYSRQAASHLAQTVGMVFRLKEDEILKEHEICELTENLLNTYEEITFLYKISASISVASSTTEIVDLIISELLQVLDVEMVAAVDAPGADTSRTPGRTLIAGQRLVDPAGLRKLFGMYQDRHPDPGRPYVDNHFQANSPLAADYPQVHSLMIVPLVYNRETLNVLIALNKKAGEEFNSGDVKLVASIAGESAVHLKNSQLYEDLRHLLYGIIRALSSAIDAKDPYTCGHSERVAFIARSIAERLHLSPQEVEAVYLSGLLHDVGKIGISEDVLRKHGKLTEAEMDHVRGHPEIGARILANLKQFRPIVPGVRFHHERLDGRGYPCGLKGEEIPLIGRIIAVADGYDSMTSNRPYRRALSQAVAVGELKRCSGTQFDPTCVAVLLQLLEEPHFRDIYANMGGEASLAKEEVTP